MDFTVENLPDEDRDEYVQEWAEEKGFETLEPSMFEEGEDLSLAEMLGMAPGSASEVLRKLANQGEKVLSEKERERVNIELGEDDPDLPPPLLPSELNRVWEFEPYRASDHEEAGLPWTESLEHIEENFEGLMMTEMAYDGKKVADVFLGPVAELHTDYGQEIVGMMEQERYAVAAAASRITGEKVEYAEDLGEMEIMPYETSEVPVDENGQVEGDTPAVVAWTAEEGDLYLVPERVSLEVGNEDTTEDAYAGALRRGYIDLGDKIQAPLPPMKESDNILKTLEGEQNYFVTGHNLDQRKEG